MKLDREGGRVRFERAIDGGGRIRFAHVEAGGVEIGARDLAILARVIAAERYHKNVERRPLHHGGFARALHHVRHFPGRPQNIDEAARFHIETAWMIGGECIALKRIGVSLRQQDEFAAIIADDGEVVAEMRRATHQRRP